MSSSPTCLSRRVALVIFASTKPDTFHVERTATIAAPPEKIVPLINDFHQWQAWSPYEKLDPGMSRTIGGAPSGQGATYAWDGSGKAGAGRMEILESSAEKVVIKLDFSKPFEAHNVATFTLLPAANGTTVTWAMDGPAPLIASLSLGATRRFLLRHRGDPSARLALELEPGSLLLMSGPTQRHWKHALPRTKRPVGERINLTFRHVAES